MNGNIYCNSCAEHGRKPQILGKYEDVIGAGDLLLWCKKCRKEIRIKVDDISCK